MKLRTRIAFICAFIAPSGACMQFHTAPPSPCYRLTKGPWSIPILPASDSALHTPPPFVHLTMQVDSTNGYRRVAIGYSTSDSVPVFRTVGTWGWAARDSLRLGWGDMYSGVGIDLGGKQDSLSGFAHIYSDDLSAPYLKATAPVVGVATPCPAE